MSDPDLKLTIKGRPASAHRAVGTDGDRYKPQRTRQYQARVAELVRAHRPDDWPIDAYYELTFRAVYPNRQWADRDNIDKVLSDALEGVLWENDLDVVDGQQQKRVLPSLDKPFVDIEVRLVDDETVYLNREADPDRDDAGHQADTDSADVEARQCRGCGKVWEVDTQWMTLQSPTDGTVWGCPQCGETYSDDEFSLLSAA